MLSTRYNASQTLIALALCTASLTYIYVPLIYTSIDSLCTAKQEYYFPDIKGVPALGTERQGKGAPLLHYKPKTIDVVSTSTDSLHCK